MCIDVSIKCTKLRWVVFAFSKVLQGINLVARYVAVPVINRYGLVVAAVKVIILKVAYLAGKFIIFYNYYNGILYIKQFNTATGLTMVAQYAFAAKPVRFRVDKLKWLGVGKFFFGSGFVFYTVFIGHLGYCCVVCFVEKLSLRQPVLYQLI